jgi:putative transposase
VVARPQPTEATPQHLCLDKAYDNAAVEAVLQARGYTPHIRRIGEEKLDTEGKKMHPARRWGVERTFGWLSRWRGILVRWEKNPDNYLAICKLACALLWYRKLHRITCSYF